MDVSRVTVWKWVQQAVLRATEAGHLKPLVTGLALAEALDPLVNGQDPHLTICPKTGSTSQTAPTTGSSPLWWCNRSTGPASELYGLSAACFDLEGLKMSRVRCPCSRM